MTKHSDNDTNSLFSNACHWSQMSWEETYVTQFEISNNNHGTNQRMLLFFPQDPKVCTCNHIVEPEACSLSSPRVSSINPSCLQWCKSVAWRLGGSNGQLTVILGVMQLIVQSFHLDSRCSRFQNISTNVKSRKMEKEKQKPLFKNMEKKNAAWFHVTH